jgi:hypothetical protein
MAGYIHYVVNKKSVHEQADPKRHEPLTHTMDPQNLKLL